MQVTRGCSACVRVCVSFRELRSWGHYPNRTRLQQETCYILSTATPAKERDGLQYSSTRIEQTSETTEKGRMQRVAGKSRRRASVPDEAKLVAQHGDDLAARVLRHGQRLARDLLRQANVPAARRDRALIRCRRATVRGCARVARRTSSRPPRGMRTAASCRAPASPPSGSC